MHLPPRRALGGAGQGQHGGEVRLQEESKVSAKEVGVPSPSAWGVKTALVHS